MLNGLSAGAYSVGNTLLELDARGGRDAFYDRIQSAVYDCPVDFDGVPKGVSSAMLGEGTPLQKLGESAIRLYLSLGRYGKVGELVGHVPRHAARAAVLVDLLAERRDFRYSLDREDDRQVATSRRRRADVGAGRVAAREQPKDGAGRAITTR